MMPARSHTITNHTVPAIANRPPIARPVVHQGITPLCATCLGAHRNDEAGQRLCLRYRYVRALVRHVNSALIDGERPLIDDIIERIVLPAALRDGGNDERITRGWGRVCLTSYRDFLRVQRFACIVDAGRRLLTSACPIRGGGPAIAFTDYIDLAAVRGDGTVACAVVTMGPAQALRAYDAAATFVLHQLAAHAYQTDHVEIVRVSLPSGLWESEHFAPEHLVGGAVQPHENECLSYT